MPTSAVVSTPGGRPGTGGTAMGTKVMSSGWRLKGCSFICVLVGIRNEILWPFLASLLERWRKGVRWPRANQGYIAM